MAQSRSVPFDRHSRLPPIIWHHPSTSLCNFSWVKFPVRSSRYLPLRRRVIIGYLPCSVTHNPALLLGTICTKTSVSISSSRILTRIRDSRLKRPSVSLGCHNSVFHLCTAAIQRWPPSLWTRHCTCYMRTRYLLKFRVSPALNVATHTSSTDVTFALPPLHTH
ncbi:hypothetical protein BV25DRAFT_967904 [Artomyces pyxidatus]|uniref:Uncharacterized protein n=1 Tax=Artomyces pyxidatus TaxID=48021 RepID=A0ACB8SVJ8_9AGAM|nr:hypothetical protein BV25DRAFT_967904 [Artomyces pyxidatus]